MTRQRNVLLVAHDRGGVNLLVPLLMHWRQSACGIAAEFLGTPMIQHEVASMSRAAFGADLPASTLPVTASPMHGQGDAFVGRGAWTFSAEQLDRVLDSKPWDLVLTGTSAVSAMEKATWALCRKRGIPHAAMCDMWTEYRRRIVDDDGSLGVDHVLVLDRRMADEFHAEFGDAVRTTIVGSPHFSHLLASRNSGGAARDRIRFISEPIAALFPNAGIHELSVAEMVIDSLRRAGETAPLVLRPHPQDDSEGWRRFAYDYRANDVRLDDEPSWACLLSTRMAIGISSMMLIEFAMAGIPVASFQPPEADESYFCLHEADFGIAIVRDREEVVSWLREPQAPAIDGSFIAQHASSIDAITSHIRAGTLLGAPVITPQ